jgi:hypothetical protein
MSNECDLTSISTFGTIPTDAHYVRTNLQRFVSDQPRSSFEKTGRVNSKAHTLSTYDESSESRARRSTRIASARKGLYANPSDSTCTRNEGTELRVPVWHSGTRKAIEKKGSSGSTYKESPESYAYRAEIEKVL